MPYDWEGNWVESKADRHADSLGIGEIGGIGQLIYRAVRFKEYEYIGFTEKRGNNEMRSINNARMA